MQPIGLGVNGFLAGPGDPALIAAMRSKLREASF
jgi:hypothetical protein